MAEENDGLATRVLIGLALVGIAAAILIPTLTVDDPPPEPITEPSSVAETPMANTGLTAEEPELLPVPRGLKGLAFGSTVGETLAALADAQCDETPFWLAIKDPDEPAPPGPHRHCTTTIGTQQANCDLFFSVDDRLSAMACSLETGDSAEVYDAVLDTIRKTLTQNHGAARHEWMRDGPLGIIRDSGWVWEDDGARLELRSSWSGVTLINTSHAHGQLMRERTRQAARASEEEAQREAREEQRKLEEIEKNRNAFDRDL